MTPVCVLRLSAVCDCVGTDDTTVQGLMELKAHRIRRSRRVFQMIVRSNCRFWIRVQKVDECEMNARSSFLVIESFRYKTTLFDSLLELYVPCLVDLCVVWRQYVLHTEVSNVRTYRRSFFDVAKWPLSVVRAQDRPGHSSTECVSVCGLCVSVCANYGTEKNTRVLTRWYWVKPFPKV